jgi:hypothetical protein
MNENLKLAPVKNYEPPKIPTLKENNSEALKKLPSRWKKNARVIACIGLLGTLSFAQLASPVYAHCEEQRETLEETFGEISENGLLIRAHFDDFAGGAPFYVVHFTEQEALNIIRTRLESEGFNFNAPPPEYIALVHGRSRIKLFDAEKGVGVLHIIESVFFRDYRLTDAVLTSITEDFAEQTDISVGVFYTPETAVDKSWWIEENNWQRGEPSKNIHDITKSGQTEARAQLENKIAEQVKTFIDFLHSEGVLGDLPRTIHVRLNGKRLPFEVPPMIENDITMVPFREIFAALGLEIEWNTNLRKVVGRNEKITIELPINSQTALVNGEEKFLAAPATIRNGRTFVPLRFVAEATGANVDWNAATRTVSISDSRDTRGFSVTTYKDTIDLHVGLTDAEMKKIILEQFAAEGIEMTEPTDYLSVLTRQRNAYSSIVTGADIVLHNTELGIATAIFFKLQDHSLEKYVEQERIEGVTVGLFYSDEIYAEHKTRVTKLTDAEILKLGEISRKNFIAQVQDFIKFLRDEKIIPD